MECFVKENYADVLLGALFDSKSFCDVTFIVGKSLKRIVAHKLILSLSNSYFESLFTLHPSDEIEIKTIEAAELESIIKFIYTGAIEIPAGDEKTVLRLLEAAHLMQFPEVVDYCFHVLVKHTDVDHCVALWALTRKFDEKQKCNRLFTFVASNFCQLKDGAEFLDLDKDAIIDLLSTIVTQSKIERQEVEIAILNWVNKDPANRSIQFNMLSQSIFITEEIEISDSIDTAVESCENGIVEVLFEKSESKFTFKQCDVLTQSWLTDFSVSLENAVFVGTWKNKKLFLKKGVQNYLLSMYDPNSKTWASLKTDLPSTTSFIHTQSIIKDLLYVLLLDPYAFYEIRLLDGCVRNMVNIPTILSFAALNEKLFIISRCRNKAIRISVFDPEEDAWSSATPININPKSFEMYGITVCHEGCIYYVGSMIHKYDPETNRWTREDHQTRKMIKSLFPCLSVVSSGGNIFKIEYPYLVQYSWHEKEFKTVCLIDNPEYCNISLLA